MIRVGVVDSGWPAGLADPNVSSGFTFFAPGDPFVPQVSAGSSDLIGHGTQCIDLIRASAPNVLVTPLRVFHKRLETSIDVLCAALAWAEDAAFDIVNLSLSTDGIDARDKLYIMCERLRQRGTIIVASATNGSTSGYPAVFEGVFGVAVADAEPVGDAVQFGHDVIDAVVSRGWMGAPLIPGRHPSLNSNSFAAAYVTGRIASLCEREGPLSLDALRDLIKRVPISLSR